MKSHIAAAKPNDFGDFKRVLSGKPVISSVGVTVNWLAVLKEPQSHPAL